VLAAVWMPTHPIEFTGECYADLEQIQAIHKTYLRRIRPFPPKRAPDTSLAAIPDALLRSAQLVRFPPDSALRAALQKSLKHKTKMRSGAARSGHSRAGK
jgi:hypothetical protein